ncbi:MAG: cation-translocating P-type ATPase [Burkholderiaceae bacterium]|nr:cation-translocating P-type ATPase [Burkholderiaceae bacterium]
MKPVDLHIDGMTCAACSSRIEKVLRRHPGVTADVSLLEHRARITGLSVDEAIAAIRRAGYDASPLDLRQPRDQESFTDPSASHGMAGFLEHFRVWFSIAALAIMLVEMGGMAAGQHGLIPVLPQLMLATIMQTVVAWPFYKGAWRALRASSANMETLISIGTLAAYSWSLLAVSGLLPDLANPHNGLYFETSVVVLAMVRLGRTLETRARGQALRALSHLTQLDQSPVETFDPTANHWISKSPSAIAAGTLIRFAANQPISLDAVITEGQTEVDESSMTGESMPVVKHVGDTIYAGCLNLSGRITAKVISEFASSRRAMIGEKILSALSSRAPIAALADRVAAVFVPAVMVIALATLFGHMAMGTNTGSAIAHAVAVLVVACPCALGLATPAAIAAGLARSAQFGWFFRSADALQRAAEVDHVVFDKTGTLTSGRPKLIAIAAALPESDSASRAIEHVDLESSASPKPWPDWLAAASAAEQGIEHPLAGALLSYVAGRSMPHCSDVHNHPGDGVSALIEEGFYRSQRIRVGKPAWVDPSGKAGQATLKLNLENKSPHDITLDQLHADASAIDVAIGEQWCGRLWVSDSLRADAQDAITQVKQLGAQATILSGDRNSAVQRIARLLEAIEYFGQQGPEEKAQRLDQWRKDGRHVAMVGDGINDAAAMAHAHLGVAMASGAALTLQSADLTISTQTPLRDAINSLSLARSVMRRVKENLGFAFVFNIAAIPLAAFGILPPAIAGSAMALSSAAVITNAVRLLGWKKP